MKKTTLKRTCSTSDVTSPRVYKKAKLSPRRPSPTVVIESKTGAIARDWGVFLTTEETAALVSFFEKGAGKEMLTRKPGLFGKDVPRMTATFADVAGVRYRYGSTIECSREWPTELLALRDVVSRATGSTYNYVLVNGYMSEMDSVDWHQDNEPTLVPRTSIASVSLGATRRFQMKPDKKGRQPITTLNLASGSLLEMAGTLQEEYRHRVPKESYATGVRYNLTFRKMNFGPRT